MTNNELDQIIDRATGKISDAMGDWLDAKRAYSEARAEYDGHSWDWAGAKVIERLERAQAAFAGALKEAIIEALATKE